MRRRVVTGLLALLAITMVALAVRSWRTDESDRARAVVERFGTAVADKDYGAICGGLLAHELQRKLEAVGLPCREAMRIGIGAVQQPRLTVSSVVVVDDRARAAVASGAAGETPSRDIVELRRESGSWRIASLVGTTAAGGGSGPRTTVPAAAATASDGSPAAATASAHGPAADGLGRPDARRLPDDDRVVGMVAGRRTTAERRQEARRRAAQRRAFRVQGSRDGGP